jgi:hypothetical protein
VRYQTFDEWNYYGYHVRKGERSKLKDEKGKALFSQEQVDLTEYDDEDERAKDAHFGFDGY